MMLFGRPQIILTFGKSVKWQTLTLLSDLLQLNFWSTFSIETDRPATTPMFRRPMSKALLLRR